MSKTNSRKKVRVYGAHRERQRRRILGAAMTRFDRHGIGPVTMAEITAASGLQASTIYQYFSSKDEIVWAIFEDVLEEVAARAKAASDAAGTAFDKIAALLEVMADALAHHPGQVRFLAQFDAMYARDWSAERLLTVEAKINPRGFRYFSDLIREGLADGSLRHDLDPTITLHAVINAAVGGQRRLASLGRRVEVEYGQPVDRLFREAVRILLLGLRSETPATPLPTRLRAAGRKAPR